MTYYADGQQRSGLDAVGAVTTQIYDAAGAGTITVYDAARQTRAHPRPHLSSLRVAEIEA